MAEQADNPGVRVPPPFLYAAAVIGGLLLDRAWRLPIGAGIWRIILGWVLIAAWAMLTARSVREFIRNHTSILPIRPATTLVIGGPYCFTRNPMYVALAILTAGLGFVFNTWWLIVLLVPVVIVMQTAVIGREERYLRRRFGAEYDAYTKQVRRWI